VLAQRNYPDLAVGFLPCFFLLSNVLTHIIISSVDKQKTRRLGRFAYQVTLCESKIPRH
jgi:hypothetical protein